MSACPAGAEVRCQEAESLIAVVDHGAGNLRSVEKAFQYIGCHAAVTDDPSAILRADAVVLPGVGAFADVMKRLETLGLLGVVREVIERGKPFLGICLGMQLLFDFSEEGQEKTAGLGVFRGTVRRLPAQKGLKVPHVGWNLLDIKGDSPLFKNLDGAPYVYFVHSYCVCAEDRSIAAASARHGIEFDAAVSSGNVHAVQFHPEKSGRIGLAVLRGFADFAKL